MYENFVIISFEICMFVYKNEYGYNFFKCFLRLKRESYTFFLLTGFHPIIQCNMYLYIIINDIKVYGILKRKTLEVNRFC